MLHRIFSSKNKPTFLIIGAQKCGTTSLFYYLSQHPQLNLPEIKEIHFFDLAYESGIEWYYRSFPKNPFLHYKLTGEASPYYLFHPLVPERVFKHLPKIKIIVLLRNPVDRAYSQYNHQRKLGNELIQSFEEAIINEESRISEEEEKLNLGILNESLAFRRYSYLKRGHYSVQIERWLQFFPMSQMLFIKSEDFFENPKIVLYEVYDFLKIRRILPQKLTPQNSNDYPKIAGDTRENLRKFFEVDSKKLKGLLGEKFSWE
jgi:hypothetical protein